MKLTPMELYVIYHALDARKEWITDDPDSPQEELPFLKSAFNKIKELGVELKLEPQASELPLNASYAPHYDGCKKKSI